MATFRKLPSGKIRAEVSVNGVRKSKSHNTRPEAQRWALDTEAELRGGDIVLSGKTLADALLRYSEEVSPSKRGEKWERIRCEKIARSDLAQMPMTDISPAVLNRWIEGQLKTLAASSINRELNLLSSVWEQARTTWQWAKENPIREVRRPKNPRARDRRISETEISRILDALEYTEGQPVETQRQEIAVAFLLAIETAMRQGEIWALEWQDVYLVNRYVHLPKTKNGTARDVPLSSRAVQLLEMMQEKSGKLGRVFKSNQTSGGQLFRRALQIAGIEGLTFHDTRHEALTRLARKLEVLDLARMVGHRDPRSLMIYYNATAEEIASRLD